jgi:hypothetical protein
MIMKSPYGNSGHTRMKTERRKLPMKTTQITLLSTLFSASLLSAGPLYTREGTDPPFVGVLASGAVKPGERFSKGPVLGSRIDVDNELLEKQVGKTGPIPKDIGIHTQGSGGINRKNFGDWTRWYQEDGNTQVFRLFQGEQSVRDGVGEGGKPGRVEAYSRGITVAPGTWHEWEGTYTIIAPVAANIFQLFHEGKDTQGKTILWPFHIRMSDEGNIYFSRRRDMPGMEKQIVIAENMVGKSLRIKVRANGVDYEVYQKDPLGDGPWKLVTKGSHTKAPENRISFRWGMYCGSKKGQSIKKDAMLFVTGATIR